MRGCKRKQYLRLLSSRQPISFYKNSKLLTFLSKLVIDDGIQELNIFYLNIKYKLTSNNLTLSKADKSNDARIISNKDLNDK